MLYDSAASAIGASSFHLSSFSMQFLSFTFDILFTSLCTWYTGACLASCGDFFFGFWYVLATNAVGVVYRNVNTLWCRHTIKSVL